MSDTSKQQPSEYNTMRKRLVLLIAKYCRILKAVNRLKCGKKLRSSVFSTLNKLRHSLARLDKAMRGELVTFKSGRISDFRTVIILDTCQKIFNMGVSKIITTI